MILLGTLVIAAASLGLDGNNLYTPVSSIADQKITLKNYGSGSIAETDETSYEGALSIRVSSRNYFQGGTMSFDKPYDLSSWFSDKNNLLFIALRTPENTTVAGGGGAAGGGGSPGIAGAGGGGAAGGGDGQDGGGGGRPGGLGGNGGGGAGGGSTVTLDPLNSIRLVVTTTDGKKSEAYVSIKTSGAGAKGWRTVGVPLQSIRGLELTNKVVQSITFAGNSTATFYVGQVSVQNDATPIYGEMNVGDMNVGTDTQITFTASGFGGASILKYTWDFDSANGISVDAEGQSVQRRFRKPGVFTVTLTISDEFGLKKPYTRMVKITVN